MTEKTKSLSIAQNTTNFRYSQSSLNSTDNSETDYNLYCFSQGYKNHEKGYWRGVLRNKNIDFDLRFNKDWNRRIELEPDDSESLSQTSTQFSNDLIKFINDNEIGWDVELFQNFKKKQSQAGVKKQKNKEWLLSNGVKRTTVAVGLRTQNYKQFEENEKNKEFKKAQAKLEEKYSYQKGKKYDYSDKKITGDKYFKSNKTAADILNVSKSISSSANIKEQKGLNNYGVKNKRIENTFTADKKETDYTRRNLETEYNKHQGSIKAPAKGYEKQTGYGANYYSGKKETTEFRYGQKGTFSDQKENLLIRKTSDFNKADNLGRLEISVEKKNKQKIEIQPEGRTHERLCSSKKRKLSYDEDGKPLKNTSRLNVSTGKKKAPRERLPNIGRIEISAEKKKKERIERVPGPRKNERVHSSRKRKLSLDEDGKPLKNTARLNVSTEKKKPPRERLDNLSKLDISVEGKRKKSIERVPGPRKHDRIHSSKKRKLSLDKDGKPLKNTARLNVSTEKKKEPRKRLDNFSRLEVSVEGKKKKSIERVPGPRNHDRIHSSKKKRKVSLDKDGKPLTNTARLNVSTERKKAPRERLENFSRLEISVEGKKKKERIEREIGPRKHDRVLSSKKKRKTSYDSEGNPLTNTSRLKVGYEKNELKYIEKDEYEQDHNKYRQRYDSFNKGDSEFAFKKYPQNQYSTQKKGISSYQQKQGQITPSQKRQEIDATRSSYNYPGTTQKPTAYSSQMNKYIKSNYLQKTQTKSSTKPFGLAQDYQQYTTDSKTQPGYNKNVSYTVSSSQLNTATTTTRNGRPGRMNKSVERSDNFLFGEKKQYDQVSTTTGQEQKRYIAPGQKAVSVPKKYGKPGDRRIQSGYKQTPTQKPQQVGKPSDSVKIDLSKYYTKQSGTAQKSKANEPEIYEYYPLSKTTQKNKLSQINKQIKPSAAGSKTSQKEKYPKQKISESDIYEYNPIKKNLYDYKPAASQINIKKGADQRRFASQSTEAGYKGASINRQSYKNISEQKPGIDGYDSRFTTLPNKSIKTPSYLNQKDKEGQSLNNRYLLSPFSEYSKKEGPQRTKSIQNNKYATLNPSYDRRGSMPFFRLQFLTTKQVCEKFWKQIDTGEISVSMFEPFRNSGNIAKLSNFLSPEKNTQSKISMSNDNTEYTVKNSKFGGFSSRFNSKGMSSSNSESILKNMKDRRQSYKSGIN